MLYCFTVWTVSHLVEWNVRVSAAVMQSDLKHKTTGSRGGHVPQCPIDGDAKGQWRCGRGHKQIILAKLMRRATA